MCSIVKSLALKSCRKSVPSTHLLVVRSPTAARIYDRTRRARGSLRQHRAIFHNPFGVVPDRFLARFLRVVVSSCWWYRVFVPLWLLWFRGNGNPLLGIRRQIHHVCVEPELIPLDGGAVLRADQDGRLLHILVRADSPAGDVERRLPTSSLALVDLRSRHPRHALVLHVSDDIPQTVPSGRIR